MMVHKAPFNIDDNGNDDSSSSHHNNNDDDEVRRMSTAGGNETVTAQSPTRRLRANLEGDDETNYNLPAAAATLDEEEEEIMMMENHQGGVALSDQEEASLLRQRRLERRTEFVATLAFFAVGMIVSYVLPWPAHKERPIPFQYISTTNDMMNENNNTFSFYVRNLVYNEELPSGGETVSTLALLLLTGPLPAALQYALSYYRYKHYSYYSFDSAVTPIPAAAAAAVASTPHLDTGSSSSQHCHVNQTLMVLQQAQEDRHNTLCAYLFGKATETVVMECIKLYCGYLRPVFYAICQPNDINDNDGGATLSSAYDYCTNDNDAEVDDARKSFPSGHASQAFSGLLLLTLYVDTTFGVTNYLRQQRQQKQMQQLQLHYYHHPDGNNDNTNFPPRVGMPITSSSFRRKRHARLCSILGLAPTALAVWIAASRVHDNKHFPADVVAGTLLGAAVAVFSHHLWFSM